MAKKEEVKVERGSGNVFADLGLEKPNEHLAKAQLVLAISDAIKSVGLTQARAAHTMGIDQPKVSNLLRGDFTGFSLERLYRCLNSLGHDVTITVQPRNKDGEGQTSVQVS